MKHLRIGVAAALGSVAFTLAAAAQTAPAPAPAMQLTELKPGLDDVMTAMVQPRHLKLHAAAEAKNWHLAAFQLDEPRASFRRIGQYIPKYRNKDFAEAVTNTMGPNLTVLETAIKAKDAKAFKTAFADVTASCNACHVFMEHPFLVIKVPRGAAALYPDQEFKAPKD